MAICREFLCLVAVIILVGHISAATTKSWQHSDKMKDMELSRAAVPLKRNKISDKLAYFDTVQPTQSMSAMGGFADHSDVRRKSGSESSGIKVNNKLDKIQSGKAFIEMEENLPRYNIGPGVNVTLDMPREIVNVNLDEDHLKDVFQGKNLLLQR